MSINVKVFGVCAFLIGSAVIVGGSDFRVPGNNQGYEPEQPIAYSHRLHAGDLGIDCIYCHYGAPKSRHAGIPSASVCMNCHGVVTSSFDAVIQERTAAEKEQREVRKIISPELRKLYDALGLGDDLKPDPSKEPQPIEWVRVHNLPDFVYFDHRVHVARGLACESCHGPVSSMERIRQESDLTMGWCVDCHRANAIQAGGPIGGPGDARNPHHVSTDCAICHF